MYDEDEYEDDPLKPSKGVILGVAISIVLIVGLSYLVIWFVRHGIV
jgi:hypothetical protein